MGVTQIQVVLPARRPLTATQLIASLVAQTEAKETKVNLSTEEKAVSITVNGETVADDATAVAKILDQTRVLKFLLAPPTWTVIPFPTAVTDRSSIMALFGQLNKQLQLRTYIEGHRLSVSDLFQAVELARLVGNDASMIPGARDKAAPVYRWYSLMLSLPFVAPVLAAKMPTAEGVAVSAAKEAAAATKSEAEKFAELEKAFASRLVGAEMGKVVTRFPPEPSGYLHVGHAKAVLLNSFYARYFKGRMLVRFDDTNPTKEKHEFEEAILEDLKTLGVAFEGPSYTSDYFDQLEAVMVRWLAEGRAYVDDTPPAQMKDERLNRVQSCCRSLTSTENLRRFEEMRKGSEEGLRMCVRAKINMADDNGAMRDPVCYRCNVEVPHPRTGTQYKVYPTYDFACPLVDSWSGVTHAMRTNEYADRIPQYYWVQEAAGVRRTIIYEFSRLNFTNTLLSKRKLTWLVDTGVVTGWDDPRFPTVRGLIRRGLVVRAMHEFLVEQGPSKNVNLMEWDKLWAKNARVIDPTAVRYMAVDAKNTVPMEIDGVPSNGTTKQRPKFPKDPSKGHVEMLVTPTVMVEAEDAAACADGEEVTLMRLGNVIVNKIVRDPETEKVEKVIATLHLEGDVKKTKKKMHWVQQSTVAAKQLPFILREFDHIITKKKPEEDDTMESIVNRNSVFDTECLGEPLMRDLQEGDFVQLERRGFCRVDRPTASGLMVLHKIPDGKMKAMSALSTKVDAAGLSKGGTTGASLHG